MRILVTNDDGFAAKGIRELVGMLRPMGEIVVVAPKEGQSGMSMAVTMGHKPIAVKKLSEEEGVQWWYLDGTPASCVKFGIDNIMTDSKPDLVISGINHGSNAATATLYSGTVGAAMEGAINGIPSVAVSLDTFDKDADFSVVLQIFPALLEKLLPTLGKNFGSYVNINFPDLPVEKIKGTRVCNMGFVHWEDEYRKYFEWAEKNGVTPRESDLEYARNAEPGAELYVMVGDLTVNPGNKPTADHALLKEGYITVTPQKLDATDYEEFERLCAII